MESGLKFSSDTQATCLVPTAMMGLPHSGKRGVSLSHFSPWTVTWRGDPYPRGTESKVGENESPAGHVVLGMLWLLGARSNHEESWWRVVVRHLWQERGVPATGHASRAADPLSFLQGRGLLGPS